MNHPALVKTSHQPSFISANFLLFTSAEALQSSDISPVPSLKLKPNPYGGTAKKMISPYKTFVEVTQKKKIKQATKSKTSHLASNALLGPSKRQKRKVCWDPTPSDTPCNSMTLLFLSLTIQRKMTNKMLIVCSVLVISLKTTMKTRYDVRNVSDVRTHFVLVWRKTVFGSLVRDKHTFVLSLYKYPLYFLIFFYFVTILCAFFVNYSPPQIRNNVCS